VRPNIEEVRPGPADPPPEPPHDTVGVLALDARGVLAGACSTSGLAFKLPGRVGDSPIIGHGLYVDPRRGAAVATGMGELIMGVCGTFLAVDRMGRGAPPAEAALEVMTRLRESYDLREDHQVGLIALAPDGGWSSASLRPGFRVAVRTADRDELVDAAQVLLA
jgi:L-asparaginase/N4-(beta-N-acetylglucosaminyl)-L-asparaginase